MKALHVGLPPLATCPIEEGEKKRKKNISCFLGHPVCYFPPNVGIGEFNL